MRNSGSEDYFSFMSERGKSKLAQPRPAAVVPPPTVFSPPELPRTNPDSGMEVTETSISDSMIRQIFMPRPTDEVPAEQDD